jgi:hypothetical protein
VCYLPRHPAVWLGDFPGHQTSFYVDRQQGEPMLIYHAAFRLTLSGLALLLVLTSASAQTSQFTYQGRLTDGGTPANGSFDLQFRLFDALAGGNQVGAPVIRDDVPVNNGIFSVTLDFGANAFPGANRFLEIAVRPGASTGTFTTLSPLQPITATPYALRSLNAVTAATAATAATADSLSAACNGCVSGAQIAAGQAVKSLNGLFDNVTLAAGSNITLTPAGNTLTISAAGVANNWSLTGNAGTNPATHFLGTTDNQPVVFRANGAEMLRLSANGNFGIGTNNPSEKLSVVGNASLTGTIDSLGQSSRLRFHYDTLANLPSATTYHGMFAHVHDVGKAYFAHNGAWVPLANEAHTHAAGDIASGILGIGNGGTGIGTGPTAAGQFLRSTGVGVWAVGSLAAGDLPAGSGHYIQNTTAQQASSNFNISGDGIIGGNAGIGTTSPAHKLDVVGAINTSMHYNISGKQILSNLGTRNLFAGEDAGKMNSFGSGNSFFGFRAGAANNVGLANSFFGDRAGESNTTGDSNSFFGQSAGSGNEGGFQNSFFGVRAGRGSMLNNGSNNSFFGHTAGLLNEGNSNSFFGVSAGDTNTTGNNNTIIGALADVGSNNLNFATAIGAGAIVSTSNTIVLGRSGGQDAVQVPGGLTVTGALTASGMLSANLVNAATHFNLNGSPVLRAAGTDLSVGLSAGAVNGSFELNNSFFGYFAGAANGGGQTNSIFGSRAGESNTAGDENAFFGAFAGGSNNTGSNNSFFGTQAGFSTTSGFNNSFFGIQAGSTNETGISNTIIGALANVGSNNLNFATALGAGAIVSSSNTVVLGRSADTVLVAGGLTVTDALTASTNAGIGTNNPAARLHVRGISSTTSTPIAILESSGTQIPLTFRKGATEHARVRVDSNDDLILAALNGNSIRLRAGDEAETNLIIQGGNGNVGIGTTSPADLLDVNGDIRIGTGTTGCVKDRDGTVIAGGCSSDLRLKRGVTAFPNLLNQLTQLRPVHFYWRAQEFPARHFGSAQSYGLIAQEVEQVLPELVKPDAQGFKTVNYSKLPLLLLQGVRELKQANDALQTQNAKLQQDNATLEARVTALEQAVQKLLEQAQRGPQADKPTGRQ